jgi:alkanesulfonate monooxygenase SsuD/methylene tetrahydromethanopterin reductase-like flavin-dependent oxidoreductase (luciferase family)
MREYEEAALSTHRLYFELGRYHNDERLDLDHVDDLTLQAMAEDRFVIGSVDDVVDELRRYQDFGVDRVILRLGHPAGPPLAAIMDAIELIGREVIPILC